MNAGVTSERVYDALKARLLSGDILPGDRLEPAAFAETLGSSVTPVRDALHRLAGEHIVEMRPTEGFQLPYLTEVALRDLLAWNAELLRLALRRWSSRQAPRAQEPETGDYAAGIRALFAMVASHSANVEIERHINAASDRLASARVAETKIYSDPIGDLEEMSALMAGSDAKPLARRIAAYHRHRIDMVPAIVQAMSRTA